MATVHEGRMTHHYDGELVVFHIGMTVNRWWRPDLWLPVFRAMPPMLRELSMDGDSGLLGFSLLFGRRGPYVVQYWSSLDKLYAYASAPEQAHRPAWTRYNRLIRKSPGAVGVWHETYRVDTAESIYVHTPSMGLAQATSIATVVSRQDRARARFDEGRTPVASATP